MRFIANFEINETVKIKKIYIFQFAIEFFFIIFYGYFVRKLKKL